MPSDVEILAMCFSEADRLNLCSYDQSASLSSPQSHRFSSRLVLQKLFPRRFWSSCRARISPGKMSPATCKYAPRSVATVQHAPMQTSHGLVNCHAYSPTSYRGLGQTDCQLCYATVPLHASHASVTVDSWAFSKGPPGPVYSRHLEPPTYLRGRKLQYQDPSGMMATQRPLSSNQMQAAV